MKTAENKLRVIITWMAGFMAFTVGLILPLSFFTLSFSYQSAELQTEAEINSRIVTQLINANPEMWRYEELRFIELLKRRPSRGIPESRRILDMNKTLIAESSQEVPWPVQTRTAPLLDSGTQVGLIEIGRSLRPLFGKTILLTFLGAVLGGVVFRTLGTLPLAALRNALQSLFEEKERLQVTLHSIGDGVITTDAHGRVILLNPVAESLTGWGREEARGKQLDEVFLIVNQRTRAAIENPVDRVLRERKTIELANDTILIARDRSERVIADSGAPILGKDGSILGVVLVFRDITAKHKLSEEMQKAAKLESLGVLAGGIAHDFNNILTSIMGNVSLARLDTRPEDRISDCLASAEAGCQRAKDLTQQLLTFAKGGTPVKESVSLAELIRSSADFALTGSNIRAEITIEHEIPLLELDSGQINQVLHNLLINAVEAMPSGGTVAIRAERIILGKEKQVPLPEGLYVRISVRDRGVGIPREHQDRIFDPYFTTKQRGSGLGLATCHSIICNHGGHITVESEQGWGSLFQLYLPATSTAAASKRPSREKGVIPGNGTILVMDDEESVRATIGTMLSVLGYRAVFARDGREAIERYRAALGSAEAIDAVILDLTVPGGMSGKEAVETLRELDSGIRAIVSSGYSENPVMSDPWKYGFNEVLSKPYDVTQLSRVLQKVLNEGKAGLPPLNF